MIQAYGEDKFVYDSHGKRDPFAPLVGDIISRTVSSLEDVMTIDDVSLQGIASDSRGNMIAILNGEIIKEGEAINRLKAKQILADRIILIIDGTEYQLNLYEPEADK